MRRATVARWAAVCGSVPPMETTTVRGRAVPRIGFGTWRLRGRECRDAVADALAAGLSPSGHRGDVRQRGRGRRRAAGERRGPRRRLADDEGLAHGPRAAAPAGERRGQPAAAGRRPRGPAAPPLAGAARHDRAGAGRARPAARRGPDRRAGRQQLPGRDAGRAPCAAPPSSATRSSSTSTWGSGESATSPPSTTSSSPPTGPLGGGRGVLDDPLLADIARAHGRTSGAGGAALARRAGPRLCAAALGRPRAPRREPRRLLVRAQRRGSARRSTRWPRASGATSTCRGRRTGATDARRRGRPPPLPRAGAPGRLPGRARRARRCPTW